MTSSKEVLLLILSLMDHHGLLLTAADGARLEKGTQSFNAQLLTRDKVSKILFTAMDDDVTLQHLSDDHDRIENDNHRRLQGMASEEIIFTQDDDTWQKMVEHGWNWSKRRHRRRNRQPTRRNRNLRSDGSNKASTESNDVASGNTETNSPFVVCSEAPGQSGYQRRQSIMSSFNIPIEHTQTVYNTDEESCFIVTSTANAMESYQSELLVQADFDLDVDDVRPSVSFGPLVDLLKLPKGTALNILDDDSWAPPRINSVNDLATLTRTVTNEFSYDNSTEEVDMDIRKWSRTFTVDLLPGSLDVEEDVQIVANEIVEYVKDMAMVPPNSASSNLRSNSFSDPGTRIAEEVAVSTREAFSLTATDETSEQKRTFHNAHSIWSTALSEGFEASHGCQVMLDTIEVKPRRSTNNFDTTDDIEEGAGLEGFEVVLHPPSQFMKQAAVDSSAFNKHCALSLLMGLSIHPSVQTVEVGQQIELADISMMSNDAGNLMLDLPSFDQDSNDGSMLNGEVLGSEDVPSLESHNYSQRKQGVTNPQWITQSGKVNSRPFFDVGLDGTGQVTAVADGGLDIDNCYFRDASYRNRAYGKGGDSWAFANRKVVHYDDTFGDRSEKSGGHGTLVSSILAGKKSPDGRTEVVGHADGTAPGSSLAFFDMENGYYGISDPGVDRLLASLYNPGSNGSTKGARVINASWGRSYNGQYTSFCRQYDSALRNTYPDLVFVVSAGNTGREGVRSIQDPADCKNPFAVGSSLSHGTDLRSNEMGIEYLADYSSRGPTQDLRMKPDIVAPGHFILAANSNPNKVGECDGQSDPNVKSGAPGGDGVKYTTGTSMAAPVLAGTAAILRQYFEEGYCNSSNCCGSKGCGASINPSGPLIKAILMNGAQPLRGGVQYVPGGDVLEERPLRVYDSNQGMGRVNLLRSVPLRGENNLKMIYVNDKVIANGNADVYKLWIDKTNCNDPLSVTLAWYDPPAAVGCTNCIMNNLDLSVKTPTGTKYPNGRTSRDTKNTVERVRTSPAHGNEVRVFVHAQNFSTQSQKYSLAITGCFREEPLGSAAPPATPPSPQQQPRPANEISTSSASACPSSSRFQLELQTTNDGPQLTWNLIRSLKDGGVKQVANGPSSNGSYLNGRKYVSSACLEPSSETKYRFQLRSSSGNRIKSDYKLTFGGQVIFNTQWSSAGQLGKTSTFRFLVNSNGKYQKLGSNTFSTNVQMSDVTEIGADGGTPSAYQTSFPSGLGANSMVMAESKYEEPEYDDGEGEAIVGSLDYLYSMDYNINEYNGNEDLYLEDDDNDPIDELLSMDYSVNEYEEDTSNMYEGGGGEESVGSVDHFLSMDYSANDYSEEAYGKGEGSKELGSVDHFLSMDYNANVYSEEIYDEGEGSEELGSVDHFLSMAYNADEYDNNESSIEREEVLPDDNHGGGPI